MLPHWAAIATLAADLYRSFMHPLCHSRRRFEGKRDMCLFRVPDIGIGTPGRSLAHDEFSGA
jgi:hypothetical protein